MPAALAVGNAERNGGRWIFDLWIGFLAKDGLDVRRVAINVRQHDDDITRLDGGWITFLLIKDPKQLIVKDFDFPLRAVCDMKADGVILEADRYRFLLI